VSVERFSGLTRVVDGDSFTIVAPGCSEIWVPRVALPAGWTGIRSTDGSGMSVEVDDESARVVLEEQTTYTVRVGHTAARYAGLGTPTVRAVTDTHASESVFRLDTGNLVGLTTLVFDATEPAPLALRIRVRKLGDPDADFEWLVSSVVADIRALALTVASPTGLKTARTHRGASYAYEDLVFLRAIADEVVQAVARIARNPHRRIRHHIEQMDSWLAPEVAPAQLAAIAGDGRAIARVTSAEQRRLISPAARKQLSRDGERFAPLRLPAIRRAVDYDTYENRFVRFVITSFRRRALAIADAGRQAGRPDLAKDADGIALRFAALLRVPPFSFVGDLAAFVSTSQVLLREDAYNALLRLYREFVLTADVVWNEFRALQESRNVAQLYEMWVYLETVRAVANALERAPTADDPVSALVRTRSDGLHINLAEHRRSSVRFAVPGGSVRVSYNETYGRQSTDPRAHGSAASYSLPLRPDVSVVVSRGDARRRVFLDAKYRIDGFGAELATGVDAGEETVEVTGTFKPADVYKMHTYRDAVGGAFAAVAVYPGTETRLYPQAIEDFTERGGVGALPLRPRAGIERSGYTSRVRMLLDAAWASMEPQ